MVGTSEVDSVNAYFSFESTPVVVAVTPVTDAVVVLFLTYKVVPFITASSTVISLTTGPSMSFVAESVYVASFPSLSVAVTLIAPLASLVAVYVVSLAVAPVTVSRPQPPVASAISNESV